MNLMGVPKFGENDIAMYEYEGKKANMGTVRGVSVFPNDIVYAIENHDNDEIEYVSETYMQTFREWIEGEAKNSIEKCEPREKGDMVYHPKHYNQYSIEVIQLIEEATAELKGIQAVCLGNILKYLLRFQYKNGLEDVEKSKFYLEMLIESMKQGEQNDKSRKD